MPARSARAPLAGPAVSTAVATQLTHVLLEDTGLGEQLGAERRPLAERECVARTVRMRPGHWAVAPHAPRITDGIGLLVLDGFLTRRVGLDGRFGAELLGAGDLIGPWQQEDAATTLPLNSDWRILRTTRFAVLDMAFTARAARYPEVVTALLSRAIRRARRLAIGMAIVHHPRIDVRVHMLLWELADRWGTVHPTGVHLPIRLTHEVLGELVAAHRPSVTKALSGLADKGAVHWDGREWILHGRAPGELGEEPVDAGVHA